MAPAPAPSLLRWWETGPRQGVTCPGSVSGSGYCRAPWGRAWGPGILKCALWEGRAALGPSVERRQPYQFLRVAQKSLWPPFWERSVGDEISHSSQGTWLQPETNTLINEPFQSKMRVTTGLAFVLSEVPTEWLSCIPKVQISALSPLSRTLGPPAGTPHPGRRTSNRNAFSYPGLQEWAAGSSLPSASWHTCLVCTCWITPKRKIELFGALTLSDHCCDGPSGLGTQLLL